MAELSSAPILNMAFARTVSPRYGPNTSAAPSTSSLTLSWPPSEPLTRCAAVLIAALALLKLAKYMLNFSSFSRATLAHSESAASFAKIASKCSTPLALGEGRSTGLGSALRSLRCKNASKAELEVSSNLGARVGFEAIASARRCDSRARRMIYMSAYGAFTLSI